MGACSRGMWPPQGADGTGMVRRVPWQTLTLSGGTHHASCWLLMSTKKKGVSPFWGRKFMLALKFKTNFRILTEEKQSLGG